MKSILWGLVLILLPITVFASDWSIYGATKDKGGQIDLFYDASGIHKSQNTVKVWTMGFYHKHLGNYLNKHNKDKKFSDKVAKRLLYDLSNQYEYLRIPDIRKQLTKTQIRDRAIDYAMSETIVNSLKFQPRVQTYFEINCAENSYRILSMTIYGNHGHTEGPANMQDLKYKYFAPDSTMYILSFLSCRSK